METKQYDIVIIGGGVTGTALFYTLSKYTTIKHVVLLEKHSKLAQVNSHFSSNSQTLHFGDIETNYSFEKAKKVKEGAEMVRRYIEREQPHEHRKLFSKYTKMVLAVGEEQVHSLEKRYEQFKTIFPNLKKLGRAEIQNVEPKLIEGRSQHELVLGLHTEKGYTMDYEALAHSFAENALNTYPHYHLQLGTKVKKIEKTPTGYKVVTHHTIYEAQIVVVAAGGYSLLIAKSLGYGKEFFILSVAGSFYTAPHSLNGKVYTMQMDKLPFAAIHGDPEVHNREITRFGPTAKVIPLLERYNPRSFLGYFKTFGLGSAQIASIINILSDKTIFKYIMTNFLYDIPWLGKLLFIREVRKIVPSIQLNDLKYAKHTGGTRPQIVNKHTKSLEMGEAKIIGDNIIFNITPSPGASTCLKNAYMDIKKIVEFMGGKHHFDEAAFRRDFIE